MGISLDVAKFFEKWTFDLKFKVTDRPKKIPLAISVMLIR